MASNVRLLIVDDDPDILSLLTKFFQKHSFSVAVAANGDEMMRAVEAEDRFDLVILDLMLPGEDGLSLCRRLQQVGRIPVIMLTAMADLTDRIVGLEVGADDYLAKPFDARELLARVKAVLRRAAVTLPVAVAEPNRPILRFAGWRLDVARRELRSDEETLIPLTSSEFELLLAFAEHAQRVLTRDQLLDLAHGQTHEVYDRSIDLQVSRLRRKLEQDVKNPALIRTIRNGGYMFMAPVLRG